MSVGYLVTILESISGSYVLVLWTLKMCLFASVLWTEKIFSLTLPLKYKAYMAKTPNSSYAFIIFAPFSYTTCLLNNMCIFYLLGHICVFLLTFLHVYYIWGSFKISKPHLERWARAKPFCCGNILPLLIKLLWKVYNKSKIWVRNRTFWMILT